MKRGGVGRRVGCGEGEGEGKIDGGFNQAQANPAPTVRPMMKQRPEEVTLPATHTASAVQNGKRKPGLRFGLGLGLGLGSVVSGQGEGQG